MFVRLASKLKRPAVTRLAQRGDTIVEVLIAITILSMILGGAYVTTNHSLLDTRDAQEHSNATKLAETQLEELRSAAATNTSTIFASTWANSCMTSGSDTPVAATSAVCKVDATGTPTTAQPQYAQVISRTSTSAGGLNYYTFQITITWASLINNGQDSVQMSYRLDQQ